MHALLTRLLRPDRYRLQPGGLEMRVWVPPRTVAATVSDMYRVATPAALLLLLGGHAQASSFHIIEDGTPEHTPSIISLDATDLPQVATGIAAGSEAAAAQEIIPVSPSVVAVGIDAVPPQPGSVASVEEERDLPAWHAERLPQIIRGGLVGEMFSAPPTAAPELAEGAGEAEPDEEAFLPEAAETPEEQEFGPDGNPEPPAAPTGRPL